MLYIENLSLEILCKYFSSNAKLNFAIIRAMCAKRVAKFCCEPVQSKYFKNSQNYKTRPKLLKTGDGHVRASSFENGNDCEGSGSDNVTNSEQSVSSNLYDSAGEVPQTLVPSYKNDFFNVSCETLARTLLGKVLVRRLEDGTVLKGRIVETECYLGEADKACQTYGGRRTARNEPMFMKPGTSYVYLTYGMYHCFNISSQGAGAAVLVRALEPLDGLEVMTALRLRGAKRPLKKQALKAEELCSGPSKLCLAMAIDRERCNKQDLCEWQGLCVQPDEGAVEQQVQQVVVTKRIGIESAGPEWANKPLRFYFLGNRFVSKRDRAKEEEMLAILVK